MDTKLCEGCGITKELHSFYKTPRPIGYFKICRSCCRLRQKQWDKNNPEKVKAKLRRYRISHREQLEDARRKKRDEDYITYSHKRIELAIQREARRYGSLINDLLRQQDDSCPLCGKKFMGIFDIDHSHKTGLIRGLLCRKCNSGLHYFEDTDFIVKAKNYLNSTPASKFPPTKY